MCLGSLAWWDTCKYEQCGGPHSSLQDACWLLCVGNGDLSLWDANTHSWRLAFYCDRSSLGMTEVDSECSFVFTLLLGFDRNRGVCVSFIFGPSLCCRLTPALGCPTGFWCSASEAVGGAAPSLLSSCRLAHSLAEGRRPVPGLRRCFLA